VGRYGTDTSDEWEDPPQSHHEFKPGGSRKRIHIDREEHQLEKKPPHRFQNRNQEREYEEEEPEDDGYDPAAIVTRYQHRADPKSLIKQAALDFPDMAIRQIAKIVERETGHSPNLVTVANIRAELRHTLRFLAQRKLLKPGVFKIHKRPSAPDDDRQTIPVNAHTRDDD
jgi:hypothetical protein